ncbi:MAG TPA: IS3 family transposase [Thermopetrobacter sp.]|nr:IS3 family transposase [Thermopetrobacter sp.]
MTLLGDGISVGRACELAGVSRAGYYREWAEHEPRQEEAAVRDAIQRVCLAHPSYGSRRVSAQLKQEGMAVNRKRVQRLMRADNLLVLRKRRWVVTTDSRHTYAVYPNLAVGLKPAGADELWVADITYIRLREAFVCLAVILDGWSRRVVGWALGERLRAELALGALEQALAERRPPPGLVHHSDRGVQYCAGRYVDLLEEHGLRISMSRAGNPYDNALAESFLRTLKCEEVYLNEYRDVADARARIGRFLEDYYNRRRLHSSLGYRAPERFEAEAGAPGGKEAG